MLDKFRRFTKTPLGKIAVAIPAMGILAGFAMADIQSFGSGGIGFGMGSDTLAQVGDQRVTEADMNEVMQRQLEQTRQQNPQATYADLAGQFDQLVQSVIDQRVLIAFGDESGFTISKRLIDAEISQIPGTKGLNGQFTDQAYQAFLAQRRMTDAQLRQIMKGGLVERLMLSPIASNPRIAVGMAQPYASMLLESREGEAMVVPVEAFTAGLKPSDSDLQSFFARQRGRYTVPEQRVLKIARIGADQVASVTPSEQDIAAYYKANAATYAASDTRDISQVIAPDRATAEAIAKRVRGGASLAAAAGKGLAVSSLKAQSRAGYADITNAQAAAQAFSAAKGAVIGPVQTSFGWTVAQVDSIVSKSGKSLDAARGEISAKLVVEKRRAAIEDLVDKVQTAIDEGATFAEAAAAANLSATTTPLITVAGTSRAQPGFRMPGTDAPILKAGFEIPSGDPPEVVTITEGSYALVAPDEIVAAAPPPLASIRDRVVADWVKVEALKRAKAAADAIVAKTSKGMSMAEAIRQSGVSLPPSRPVAARRIQLLTAQGPVPRALETLFTLTEGKSKAVADEEGRGYGVVKVDKIIPGNALLQPGLITQAQNELRASTSDAYARQFVAAAAKYLKLERNEKAIADYKKRLVSGSSQ